MLPIARWRRVQLSAIKFMNIFRFWGVHKVVAYGFLKATRIRISWRHDLKSIRIQNSFSIDSRKSSASLVFRVQNWKVNILENLASFSILLLRTRWRETLLKAQQHQLFTALSPHHLFLSWKFRRAENSSSKNLFNWNLALKLSHPDKNL